MQCLRYHDGIRMAPLGNDTSCWEELGETPTSRLAMAETSCRNVACLAMFLDVRERERDREEEEVEGSTGGGGGGGVGVERLCSTLLAVGDTQGNTPPGRIFEARYSAPSTIPIPNDTLSESCRFDISNDTVLGTHTLLALKQPSFKNRSRGCVFLRHLRYSWG